MPIATTIGSTSGGASASGIALGTDYTFAVDWSGAVRFPWSTLYSLDPLSSRRHRRRGLWRRTFGKDFPWGQDGNTGAASSAIVPSIAPATGTHATWRILPPSTSGAWNSSPSAAQYGWPLDTITFSGNYFSGGNTLTTAARSLFWPLDAAGKSFIDARSMLPVLGLGALRGGLRFDPAGKGNRRCFAPAFPVWPLATPWTADRIARGPVGDRVYILNSGTGANTMLMTEDGKRAAPWWHTAPSFWAPVYQGASFSLLLGLPPDNLIHFWHGLHQAAIPAALPAQIITWFNIAGTSLGTSTLALPAYVDGGDRGGFTPSRRLWLAEGGLQFSTLSPPAGSVRFTLSWSVPGVTGYGLWPRALNPYGYGIDSSPVGCVDLTDAISAFPPFDAEGGGGWAPGVVLEVP